MKEEKKETLKNEIQVKLYKNKKWLEEALKTKTIKQIAKEHGVSGANISAFMRKYELRSPRERGMGRLKYVNENERQLAKKESLAKYQKKVKINKKSLLVLLDNETYNLLMEFKNLCGYSNDMAVTQIIRKALSKKVLQSVKKQC